jgi:hypothetical protein
VGLFTTTEDAQLEDARKRVVPSEKICPGCKQSFTAVGATLTAIEPALGIEAHKCPHCGFVLSSRRPSSDGL